MGLFLYLESSWFKIWNIRSVFVYLQNKTYRYQIRFRNVLIH